MNICRLGNVPASRTTVFRFPTVLHAAIPTDFSRLKSDGREYSQVTADERIVFMEKVRARWACHSKDVITLTQVWDKSVAFA